MKGDGETEGYLERANYSVSNSWNSENGEEKNCKQKLHVWRWRRRRRWNVCFVDFSTLKKCNTDKLVSSWCFLQNHSIIILSAPSKCCSFFSFAASAVVRFVQFAQSVAFRLDYFTFRSVLINLCTPVYHTLFFALFRGRLNTTELLLDVLAHSSSSSFSFRIRSFDLCINLYRTYFTKRIIRLINLHSFVLQQNRNIRSSCGIGVLLVVILRLLASIIPQIHIETGVKLAFSYHCALVCRSVLRLYTFVCLYAWVRAFDMTVIIDRSVRSDFKCPFMCRPSVCFFRWYLMEVRLPLLRLLVLAIDNEWKPEIKQVKKKSTDINTHPNTCIQTLRIVLCAAM